MVVARRGTSTVARNISMFKKFYPSPALNRDEEGDSLSDDDQDSVCGSDDSPLASFSASGSVPDFSANVLDDGKPSGDQRTDANADRPTRTRARSMLRIVALIYMGDRETTLPASQMA
ncbi:hypothetical protein NDU88_003272 [Pleurodeles waltl]|uniref:Uncharacterized protein n=1 Tax=Pleurodeles waltl TaxID=8319 RepID=A0AAV7MY15_PLEWA|nr:hypothetical protein NDU88_003272 [Pleurodeles waltl]